MHDVAYPDETPAPRWLAVAACIGAGCSLLSLIAMGAWLAVQWWG